MDGTLVDTEPYWFLAEQELVRTFVPGRDWSHQESLETLGMGLLDAAVVMQRLGGVPLDAQTIVDFLVASVTAQLDRDDLPWRPGARELLQGLRTAGVRTALVTMSVRSLADLVADRLGFLGFDVIVAGDEVDEPKPHPAPYLRAAELLGVAAHDCVAIEDSVPGLTSAVAAGTVAVGVPHTSALPDGLGDVRLAGLDGVTVETVTALFAQVRTQREEVAA